MDLAKQVIDGLERKDTSNDFLYLINLVLEFDYFRTVAGTDEEINSFLLQKPPSKEQVDIIRDKLIAIINESNNSDYVAQSIFLLGISHDISVVGIIRSRLKSELSVQKPNNNIIYQSLISIDRCDPTVFNYQSWCLMETKENYCRVQDYLKNGV